MPQLMLLIRTVVQAVRALSLSPKKYAKIFRIF